MYNQYIYKYFITFLSVCYFASISFSQGLSESTLSNIDSVEDQLIKWRRHFHANPELSNREFETNAYIVKTLEQFSGLEIISPVAGTGTVAILRGKQPGPVIALRADIDGLPVEEKNDLPFKSVKEREYKGKKVKVMHACGHDAHTAILLATAKVMTEGRDKLKGTVMFIFQPAEEGAPDGEEGGAELMLKEGIFDSLRPSAVFGLHISSSTPVGDIRYKKGATMASSDWFTIYLQGKGSHGSRPWTGKDPIQAAAGIIQTMQSIVSRRLDLIESPAVITVGRIEAGNRANIIPDDLEMEGTIRTLSKEMRPRIHKIFKETVEKAAESYGLKATVKIDGQTPVTYNDPQLTEKVLPALERSVSEGKSVKISPWTTGAEDFAFFSNEIPGVYFFLGALPKGVAVEDAPPHHTSIFYLDEKGFLTGVRAFMNITKDMTGSDF